MPMFENAQRFIVNGGIFTSITRHDARPSQISLTASDALYRSIASDAMYDSGERYDAPKCHPDTRIAVLNDLMEWIGNPKKLSGILWLHGPAGAGKSSIAQTICERCRASRQLAASFFFSRNSPSRNNAMQLFSTIAYQLAVDNPEFKRRVEKIVEFDRSILDKRMDIQLQKLILEPLQGISWEPLLRKAIVIDGLDECSDDDMQVTIINLIGPLVRHCWFPIGFIITSRPEPRIRDTFDTKQLIFVSQPISLSSFDGVEHDIRTVLQSGFSRILNDPRHRETMGSVKRPWPDSESVDTLIKKSSGHFIYPSTVLKFIDDPDCSPVTQLNIILGIQGGDDFSSLSELDNLYTEILSRARFQQRTMDVLGCILAAAVVVNDPPLPQWTFLASSLSTHKSLISTALVSNSKRWFLVLERLLSLAPGEAYKSLNQLHSLLSIPKTRSFMKHRVPIKFHHSSFTEFLQNPKRSKQYFIDIHVVHANLTRACFHLLSNPHPLRNTEDYIAWIYALHEWHYHFLFISPQSSEFDIATIQKFDIRSNFIRVVLGDCPFINWAYFNEALKLWGKFSGFQTADPAHGYLFTYNPGQHLIDSIYLSLQQNRQIPPQYLSTGIYPQRLMLEHFQSMVDATFIQYLDNFESYQEELLLVLGLLQLTEDVPWFIVKEIFRISSLNHDRAQDILEPLKPLLFLDLGATLSGPLLQDDHRISTSILQFHRFLDNPSRSGKYHVSPHLHSIAMRHVLRCAGSASINSLDVASRYNRIWMANLQRTQPSQEVFDGVRAATSIYLGSPLLRKCLAHFPEVPSARWHPGMWVSEWLKQFPGPPMDLILTWEKEIHEEEIVFIGQRWT